MKLDDREVATVLAALRHWQSECERVERGAPGVHPTQDQRYKAYFDVDMPLDSEEIDTLCERINFDDDE